MGVYPNEAIRPGRLWPRRPARPTENSVLGIRTNPECAAGNSKAHGREQRGRRSMQATRGVVCVLSEMEEQP